MSARAVKAAVGIPLTLSEDAFQLKVIAYARLRGWHIFHARAAQDRHGRWSVAMTGDVGFPDLVLARDGRVIMAELKAQKGKATPGQLAWIDKAGEHGYLWKPSDWQEILRVLA